MTKTIFAYQFKVLIQDSRPPIWRRIVVPQNFTFHDFHLTIQAAFDWENYHLHSFRKKLAKTITSIPLALIYDESNYIVDLSIPDNKEIGKINSRTESISTYFQNRDSIDYTYDFGDDWRHKITLEKIIENYDLDYPQCVKAFRHAPCEDSGGIWGWESKLEILEKYDSKNEDHRELYEWLSEMIPDIDDLDDPKKFNPELVDLDSINERLKYYQDMEIES